MKKIIVLGGGKMGTYIASKLASNYEVTIADNYISRLKNISLPKRVRIIEADLSKPNVVKNQVKNYNLVVSALPESFGYDAIVAAIETKKNIVDISFWDQTKARMDNLNELARRNKVTVFLDSGVAPGFSNALVSFFDIKLNGKTRNAVIFVGGIPSKRSRGFFASFSVSGLIEEYQTPCLRIKNGKKEKVPSLSVSKTVKFKKNGILEASVTDGLRSLAFNLNHINNMSEFTLRYPGHFNQMKILGKTGFFNEGLVNTGKKSVSAFDLSRILLEKSANSKKYDSMLKKLGFYDREIKYPCDEEKISPRKISIAVLTKSWQMKKDDRDLLVMRIEADDGRKKYVADIYARHDGVNSAMAQTTGGTAVLSARMLLGEIFKHKGAFPLELVIKKDIKLVDYYIKGLQKLGVSYTQYTL